MSLLRVGIAQIAPQLCSLEENLDKHLQWIDEAKKQKLEVLLLMANRVGKEGDLSFWGGSQILDPFGNVLAAADDHYEQMIVADLDYQSIRKTRHQLPTVRDSNLELVGREIRRIESHSEIPPLDTPFFFIIF